MRNNLDRIVSVIAACLCGGLATALPTTTLAARNSFHIYQIASSQDGTAQIVELKEMDGQNGEDRFFSSLSLFVTNRYGITKEFDFPSDLPNADTANKHVIVSTGAGGSFLGSPFSPDFLLPSEFLPTDGGTIDLVQCSECIGGATIDSWSFDAIPTDGRLLRRSGEVGRGTVQTFAGRVFNCCGPVFNGPVDAFGIDLTGVVVVEYYSASLDHYFVTGSQPDIDALDSERIPGWQRTSPNGGFTASSTPAGAGFPYALPVCRFFIPPGSHFFSASADECNAVRERYPDFVLETPAAFYAALPDLATGECPAIISYGPIFLEFFPVYRLWNNRADTNHRFTASLADRAEMIDKGWVSEGYGPMGVAMCGADWK